MSKRTRAFRRHHRERMIKNAHRKISYWSEDDDSWLDWWILRNYNHLAACSCQMCRNPRHCGWLPKKEKLTMQERKVYNVLSEEMDEFYDAHQDPINQLGEHQLCLDLEESEK